MEQAGGSNTLTDGQRAAIVGISTLLGGVTAGLAGQNAQAEATAAENESYNNATSTKNPDYAAKMLGYDRETFGDMIHPMKFDLGLRGTITSFGTSTVTLNSGGKSSVTCMITEGSDMKTHRLAHASFLISGDQVIPEFWTEYFGITPDIARKKGELFTTPAGKTSRIPARTNVWGVRSKSAIESDLLEPHFRYLIGRLGLPRAGLKEHVEREDARMRFFCYWSNETGDRVPDVPEDIETMMEALGGTVEIDEYR